MGRIRKPESFNSLLNRVAAKDFVQLTGKYSAIDSKGRYLHWDQFQWRVEEGDRKEAAWIATKLARIAISQKLSELKSEKDRHFSYCIPNSLLAQLHKIDQTIGGGHSIKGNVFSSSTEEGKNRYLLKDLMMEEAINSSQLEGASTTRKVAKQMLKNNLPPKNKSEQMILNNFLLMKESLARQDEDLSIEMILELHKIATYNAIENQGISGEIRNHDNIFISDIFGEGIYYPPAWETLEHRLNSLIDFANCNHSQFQSNDFIHPIIKAIILHFMIAYIHPFDDGNGRTARAIFYWYMLKSGYWLFEYVSISRLIQQKRSAYDLAFVYTETDDFDLTYFLYHQVDVILKAVEALQNYIDRKQKEFYEFAEWINKSPLAKKLKRQHLEILKQAVKEPGKEFTSKQVSLDLEVTENTARSYLNKLAANKLLKVAKDGRTMLYVAPANLRDKLKL